MEQYSDSDSEPRGRKLTRADSNQRSDSTPQDPGPSESEDRKQDETQCIRDYIKSWRDRGIEVTVERPIRNSQEYRIMVIMKSWTSSPVMEELEFHKTGTDLRQVMEDVDNEIEKTIREHPEYDLDALAEMTETEGESESHDKEEESHATKGPRSKAQRRSKTQRMVELWLRKKCEQMSKTRSTTKGTR